LEKTGAGTTTLIGQSNPVLRAPKEGQQSVTIRVETYAEIRRLVKRNPELYGSIAEFVKQAINDLILKTRAGRRYRHRLALTQ